MRLRLGASFWARPFCGWALCRAGEGAGPREGVGVEARLRVGEAAGARLRVGGCRAGSIFLAELFSDSCKRCFATVIHGR